MRFPFAVAFNFPCFNIIFPLACFETVEILTDQVRNSTGTSAILSWNMLTEDVTFDHFRLYRAASSNGTYACLHEGCQTKPYINGCECTGLDTGECATGSSCG